MEPYIMVIEDSQAIRELLCDLLTDEGYAVALYATPMSAGADLDRIKPDLIILDWLFDQRALGMEMLQSLCLRPDFSAVPVVICSGATRHMQDLEPLLRRRDVQIVHKPFSIVELLGAVHAALDSVGVALQQPHHLQAEASAA